MPRSLLAPLSMAMLAGLASPPLADAADVTCYVDSVAGDDDKSGLSEVEAVKSQTSIDTACTTIRYRRGSVFAQKLRVTEAARLYANYGDASAPLPRFEVPSVRGISSSPSGTCKRPSAGTRSREPVGTPQPRPR